MTDKEKKYLSDVLNSIDHILAFTVDLRTFEEYKINFLVKGAVERHLAIIGEAINKFLKLSGEKEIPSARQIISLRNRLIHSYDNVDDRIIGQSYSGI
jgi:uncharacterized protein with HEPN domain